MYRAQAYDCILVYILTQIQRNINTEANLILLDLFNKAQ